MDGKNDFGGETYSRSPRAEDLIKICNSLNEHKVDYVLVGGWAMAMHGSTRTTEDIDLLINPSPSNVQKVKKALAVLPDNAVSEINDNEVQELAVVRIADEIVVDLMGKIADVNTDNAGKIVIEYQGTKILVADIDTLIKTKQGLRPRDQMDLAFLLRKKKFKMQLNENPVKKKPKI